MSKSSHPDPILDRFCLQILPEIHHKIKWLNLESSSIERILVTNYPNLYGLGLYDVEIETALSLFMDKNQILALMIERTTYAKVSPTDDANARILTHIFTTFSNLQYFNFCPSSIWNQRLGESKNDNQDFSIIKYSYLINLTLYFAHDDYIEEFLVDTNTCLPNNTVHLNIYYEQLERVTHNFTRDITRISCAKLNSLCLNGHRLPEYAKDYFPHL
ncbi:unnamed protein product [Rotaria sp. Silwood2]|nr:unnamed protein product [Rotaria sp. Silwood2]